MNYPRCKFGDCSLFYRDNSQTDRQADRQNHTDADERFTHAPVVGVSNASDCSD